MLAMLLQSGVDTYATWVSDWGFAIATGTALITAFLVNTFVQNNWIRKNLTSKMEEMPKDIKALEVRLSDEIKEVASKLSSVNAIIQQQQETNKALFSIIQEVINSSLEKK